MKEFKKYYTINAEPQMVYAALTNQHTIRLWTGEDAEMSIEPNSEFSLWSGSIVGKNLLFEQDKKIVQQWYFGEQKEESIVTIIIHEHKKGSSVELRHTNIPDQDYENIISGWNEVYFAELADFYFE
ncbi:MAG: ATPase [Cytophagales bacterium]|nr:MAG: ATPase [Cytophagales bacterium]